MEQHKWVQLSLEEGAHRAHLLAMDQVPFDETLRAYCKANLCGSYGKNHACPPDIGEVEAVIARLKRFQWALVFQSVHPLEDSFDVEGMAAAAKNHDQLTRRIFARLRAGHPEALPLGAGGCMACARCAKLDGAPCRSPERALSSIEAHCVNAAALAKLCGMRYVHEANTVTYFGMCCLDD